MFGQAAIAFIGFGDGGRMAGARQFDTEAAEAGIMLAFWRNGFAATSIEAIEAETGLRRGSLYNAFGDKQAMFARALSRYAAMAAHRLGAALAAEAPEEGVAALLAAQRAALSDPAAEAMAGCEAMPPAAAEAVAAVAAAQHAMLAAALRRWQAAGRLSPEADSEALARMLAATVLGIAALHRATGDTMAAEAAARAAVTALAAFR
jgi:TetR/AcrR family transcriptional repressor of nem operon